MFPAACLLLNIVIYSGTPCHKQPITTPYGRDILQWRSSDFTQQKRTVKKLNILDQTFGKKCIGFSLENDIVLKNVAPVEIMLLKSGANANYGDGFTIY
jgi:hypothetical protein